MSSPPTLIRTVLILCGPAALVAVAIDTFLPTMHAMASDLGVSVGEIQISLGVFSAGVAFGQIPSGPLSDRFGRRPVLLGGLMVFLLTALGCAWTENINALYLLRFLQGIAGATAMVVVRSVGRDLFGTTDSARLFGYLFFFISLMPVLGPMIGGNFTAWFGWRSVFIYMAIYAGVFLTVIWLTMAESLPAKDTRALQPINLAQDYITILRDRTFLAFAVCGIGIFIGLFSLFGGLPAVLTGMMGQTPAELGYLWATLMTFHMVAAAASGRLVDMIGIKNQAAIGVVVMLGGGLSFLALALADVTTVSALIFPSAAIAVGFALAMPPITAGALANFRNMAGRATSLMGFIHIGTGALVVTLLGILDDGGQMPLAYFLALAGCSATLGYIFLIRPAPLSLE